MLCNSNISVCRVHASNVLASLQPAQQDHLTQLRLSTAPWLLAASGLFANLHSLQHLQVSLSAPQSLWRHGGTLTRLLQLDCATMPNSLPHLAAHSNQLLAPAVTHSIAAQWLRPL